MFNKFFLGYFDILVLDYSIYFLCSQAELNLDEIESILFCEIELVKVEAIGLILNEDDKQAEFGRFLL